MSCGSEITEGAKFCEECGATQNRVAKEIQETESAAAAPNTDEVPSSVLEDATILMKTPLILSGIIVAVLVVLGCIVWFDRHPHPTSPKAQYDLGMKYDTGDGVQRDEAQAVSWFRKAAEQGNADAQSYLGVMYEDGRGGLAKDDAQAVYWYQKAAAQGNAGAKYFLDSIRAQQQGLTPVAAQGQDASTGLPASMIQFRGLRAEMSKNEVQSLLVHPGDSLKCSPGQQGTANCEIRLGDAYGHINFSNEGKLTSYDVKVSSGSNDKSAPKRAFDELVAQMGDGEHIDLNDKSFGSLLKGMGFEQYIWRTKATVPCLLDRNSQCASVEMTVNYGSLLSVLFEDWGYQARSEGLTAPDPNAPHPTFQGELSLLGLHGGQPKTEVLNVLGKSNGTVCHFDQDNYTTECTLTKGSFGWSVTFYEDRLESYRVTFPANDWNQQVASIKAALHAEPTEIDSRTSGLTMVWDSAAKTSCPAAPDKNTCPMEALILSKASGEIMATGVYTYNPVASKDIRDSVNRAMSKYH